MTDNIVYTCVDRGRDEKTGKIINYGLKDPSGTIRLYNADILKTLIRTKQIVVDNLTLTSDGRIVKSSQAPFKPLQPDYIDIMSGQCALPRKQPVKSSDLVLILHPDNTEKYGYARYDRKTGYMRIVSELSQADRYFKGTHPYYLQHNKNYFEQGLKQSSQYGKCGGYAKFVTYSEAEALEKEQFFDKSFWDWYFKAAACYYNTFKEAYPRKKCHSDRYDIDTFKENFKNLWGKHKDDKDNGTSLWHDIEELIYNQVY